MKAECITWMGTRARHPAQGRICLLRTRKSAEGHILWIVPKEHCFYAQKDIFLKAWAMSSRVICKKAWPKSGGRALIPCKPSCTPRAQPGPAPRSEHPRETSWPAYASAPAAFGASSLGCRATVGMPCTPGMLLLLLLCRAFLGLALSGSLRAAICIDI